VYCARARAQPNARILSFPSFDGDFVTKKRKERQKEEKKKENGKRRRREALISIVTIAFASKCTTALNLASLPPRPWQVVSIFTNAKTKADTNRRYLLFARLLHLVTFCSRGARIRKGRDIMNAAA